MKRTEYPHYEVVPHQICKYVKPWAESHRFLCTIAFRQIRVYE